MEKPRLAVIPGDPSGIGPELTAKALADPETSHLADILVVGDGCVLAQGCSQAGVEISLSPCDPEKGGWHQSQPYAWLPTSTIDADDIAVAKATEASGRSVLSTLELVLNLARDGIVDGFVFAPFNKEAMHLAGLKFDDELHFMADHLGVESPFSEINTLDGIWTSRVTSHIPLRKVADAISAERIKEATQLIHGLLRSSGIKHPRIAVAALNPHAGDGGNFGREEIDIIRPAVENLAKSQLAVEGPYPSDTVFLKAMAGEIDAVVTMYHDQGQIALKLLGFDRGVTVQGGLPFPVTTPAHGTAFDIAGRGEADPRAMQTALRLTGDMVRNWH